MSIYRKLQYDPTKGEPAMKIEEKIEEKIDEFWEAGFQSGKEEYRFKRDMKTKQKEADRYSVIGVCICVGIWVYLAFNIFPKG